MKNIISIIVLTSLVLSAQSRLNIYENNKKDSKIIAQLSSYRGVNILRCREVDRYGISWCKVHYKTFTADIKGWSKKKSLKLLSSKTKKYFEKRFGGRYSDIAKAILVLEDGYLIGGKTESFGAGQYDGYIIKTDFLGNKIWSSTYGGDGEESIDALIKIDKGFMFSGETQSFGNRVQSLYVGRITDDGMRLWQRGLYLDDDDRYSGKSMAKINDKNVMIAGHEDIIRAFNSDVDMQLNAVGIDGKYKWVRRYGGSEPEKANSIIRVKDGYIFAGFTDTWGKGHLDMFVVKIDESGKRVWRRVYGFKQDETAQQIIATEDGGYIIVGTTKSFRYNNKDIFVVKTDSTGRLQWQGHYGYSEDEEGFGIVEVDGGYWVCGYTKSTKNYDSQLYLLKLNHKGETIIQKSYGGIRDDVGYAIAKTEDGIVVVGYSEGGVSQGKDIYLLKLDKKGNL